MVMARKRKNPDGSIKQPNPAKGLRRGIVKWAPPHIEGEDEASHATWMHSEWKKKDTALLQEKWTSHIPSEGST